MTTRKTKKLLIDASCDDDDELQFDSSAKMMQRDDDRGEDSPYVDMDKFRKKAGSADTLIDTMLMLGPKETELYPLMEKAASLLG
jgi:hypothetical protein